MAWRELLQCITTAGHVLTALTVMFNDCPTRGEQRP